MSSPLPPYVSGVAPGTWILEGAHSLTEQLTYLGLSVSNDKDRIIARHPVSDDKAMAEIATGLRGLGFYFADGRDWSPKALLLHLRDADLFSGVIPEIYWSAQRKPHMREIP